MIGILWAIAAILLALWVLGLVFKVAGSLIHIVLVIAIILVLYNLIIGARR